MLCFLLLWERGGGGVGKQSALQRALFFVASSFWRSFVSSSEDSAPNIFTERSFSSELQWFHRSEVCTDAAFSLLCELARSLSLSGIIVLDSLSLSLSLSLIRALRDIALCFVSFFPGCILAIFCLGSFSRSPCLFQLRSCRILFFFFFFLHEMLRLSHLVTLMMEDSIPRFSSASYCRTIWPV